MREPAENPNYPVGPDGKPALRPEDLETGEHRAVRTDDAGINHQAVFAMKERVGPLDDSDSEAAETFRRFTTDPGRSEEEGLSEEQLVAGLGLRLSALGEDERYIRRQGGITQVGESFDRHVEELRVFRFVTCRELDPRARSVLDLEFGLSGEDPKTPQEVAGILGFPEDEYADVRHQAMLDAARNHRLAGYLKI